MICSLFDVLCLTQRTCSRDGETRKEGEEGAEEKGSVGFGGDLHLRMHFAGSVQAAQFSFPCEKHTQLCGWRLT